MAARAGASSPGPAAAMYPAAARVLGNTLISWSPPCRMRPRAGRVGGPPGGYRAAEGRLGGDGLLAVAAGDLDGARLGLLADRDGQGEHAGRVVGGDAVGVEGLAEEDLPGEGAGGPFGHGHLGAVGLGRGALGADGEHVLLDGQVDGVRVDAGQVQADEELAA